MGYIKQLDSVRAIAVCLVIIWHWIPRDSFINRFENGPFGVDIFFVLSGFLITRILLNNRKEIGSGNQSKRTLLKNFYVRRVLRIFPIYYLTIGMLFLLSTRLNLHFSNQELLAGITYTNNFFIYSTKSWPLATPHFWSLAVEEQFYLIWQLLMLFLPQKYLLVCIAAFISIGVISQMYLSYFSFEHLLPNSCFDCLGLGALLAWVVVFKATWLHRFYKIISITALLSAVIILGNDAGIIQFNLMRFAHAIIGTWIISYILTFNGTKSVLLSLLSNKVLITIGKLSYGLYVYHILYVYLAKRIRARYMPAALTSVKSDYQPWIFLFINFWLLLLICWLSWKFIEKPLLHFKNKFKYTSGQEVYSADLVLPEQVNAI